MRGPAKGLEVAVTAPFELGEVVNRVQCHLRYWHFACSLSDGSAVDPGSLASEGWISELFR